MSKKLTYAQRLRLVTDNLADALETIEAKDLRIQELTERLELIKSENLDLYKVIAGKDKRIDELQEKYTNERRECYKLEEQNKLFQKQFFALSANSRSMLMSMVYGLDMVTSATTHHEKEVVIRHMKTCFGKLAQKEHGLSLENEPDLPF